MPVHLAAFLSFRGTQTRRPKYHLRPRGASTRRQCFVPTSQTRQSGAAAIESALSILLLLLVATAVVEFSYWGVVRQLCRQALHDSLRISVSEHGTLQSLEQAFETVRHSRLTQAWSLQIIHPDGGTLSDFQDPFLSAQQGRPVIRNDAQREQHQRFLTRWPGGKGPATGKTIFEANLLRVELTYQHRLLSPWFRHWFGAATTRLSLQAAMQSDIHGGPKHKSPSTGSYSVEAVPHRGDLKQRNPNRLHHPSEIDPATDFHVDDPKRLARPNENKQNLTLQAIQRKAADPSSNTDPILPLHPDLAEQCGTWMCCANP